MMLSSIASTTRMKNSLLHGLRHRENWALLAVLTGSAGLNFWNLSANGWANAFYTAAVQSGLHDSESFLFGSSDWGNSISVDKPPLSLWLMGISVRLLGFNSWGLLVPQALLGVATTWLIFVIIRKRASFWASLAAAIAYATTPIVVLLSRYNNPDPLLTFLMVLALETTLLGVETRRVRWFFGVGLLLGLGFLTKQLQVTLIAPALTLGVLMGLRMGWRKTMAAGGASIAAFVAVAAGWLAFVDLTPPQHRPYVGGSISNSLTELTLGYNGLDRISSQDNYVTGLIPSRYTSSGSDEGLLRLFNANFNQEVSWALALGLFCAVLSALVIRGRRACLLARTTLIWLLTVFLVLDFMGHDIHTYYTMSIAPPMALAIGLGVEAVVTAPTSAGRRIALGVGIALSTITSWLTLAALDLDPDVHWIPWSVLGFGLLGGVLTAVPPPAPWINKVAAASAFVGLAIGPLFTDAATLSHPQTGSNPLSGSLTSSFNSISRFLDDLRHGDPRWASEITMGASPSHTLVQLIQESPTPCRWAAATLAAQTAANWQLSVDRPVMPLGGFSAIDPNPTLDQFEQLARSKSICYYIDYPEMDTIAGNQSSTSSIVSWVRKTFPRIDIDGVSVYQLNRE